MAKPRIPLPKQVEKVIKDPTQYDRRREQRVSLEGLCLRDEKMASSRKDFNRDQISKEEFEQAILRADKICINCQDPICRGG